MMNNVNIKTLSREYCKEDLLFVIFLIFGLFAGVVFYDFVEMFQYVDEISAVLLILMFAKKRLSHPDTTDKKPIYILFGVYLFSLMYSLLFGVNVKSAIFQDSIVQIKPYVGFFCSFLLFPYIGNTGRIWLRLSCILVVFFLLIINLLGMDYVHFIFKHPSRHATTVIISAIMYFYCSKYSKTNLIITMLIMLLGLISERSKFYAFFFIMIAVSILVRNGWKIRFNIKTIFFSAILCAGMFFVAWGKFKYYFIEGATDSDLMARPALYLFSLFVLVDYFPLGPGFGSYATYFSGEYYSPVYYDYGIDQLWGLEPGNSMFVADCFLPSVVQLGFLGVLVFFYFLYYIYKKNKIYNSEENQKNYLLMIWGLAFLLIESSTDSTFTQNRGLYVLIIMGCALSEMKRNFESSPERSENNIISTYAKKSLI